MLLSKTDIIEGLRLLDKKARDANITVDLAIYGGAALALAFDMRTATRDVDAVIRSHQSFVRNAVREIAADRNWPDDWLNDAVKGFISPSEQMELMKDFQGSPHGGLRIHIPTPEYLLAMKCMAMRLDDPDAAHDVANIKNLAKLLGLESPEDFFDIIRQFYPESLRVRPRSLSRIAELSCHEADGGKLQEGQRVAGPVFKILGKTSAAVQPGKRTLNHPAARENDEPLGGVRAFDDLDLDPREKDGGRLFEDWPLVAAVSEDLPQEWIKPEQS